MPPETGGIKFLLYMKKQIDNYLCALIVFELEPAASSGNPKAHKFASGNPVPRVLLYLISSIINQNK